MKKKQGRPPTGVPKELVNSYVEAMESWINKAILAGWLRDVEQAIEAIEAYEQMDFLTPNTHEHLTQWCQTWLNDAGWKRLQANARQVRFRSKERSFGPKYKRISIGRDTAIDLQHYADSHAITVSKAIERLLEK